MLYDPLTLWVLVVFATVVLAGILLFSWYFMPEVVAFGYWAAALLLSGMSVIGVGARGRIPDFVSIGLANALALLAGTLVWTGFRCFENRPPLPLAILAAPVLWILACQLPLFSQSVENRILLSSILLVAIAAACVHELRSGSDEPLFARRVAIVTLVIHAGVVAIRPVLAFVQPAEAVNLLADPRFAWYGFEWLAFIIIIVFAMVAMVRERRELVYKRASLVDELTGLFNRRGFMERAPLACRAGVSVAVLALDLDHFKDVNDRHGHPAGDRMLAVFGQVLRASMRANDVVARMGGEEFGVLMPDADEAGALEAANRIRRAFHAATAELQLDGVSGTVSIGIALATTPRLEPVTTIGPLLVRADSALYRAKARGRDRVEVARADAPATLRVVV